MLQTSMIKGLMGEEYLNKQNKQNKQNNLYELDNLQSYCGPGVVRPKK